MSLEYHFKEPSFGRASPTLEGVTMASETKVAPISILRSSIVEDFQLEGLEDLALNPRRRLPSGIRLGQALDQAEP